MDGYLDFGSDSDNDDSPNEFNNQVMEVDSDEDERNQNDEILKMLMEKSDSSYAKSRKDQAIEDFEAEMEAELDRRALEVESEGGMKHQSISRSSSSSSLNKMALPPALEQSSSGQASGPSNAKRPRSMLKSSQSKNKSTSSPKKSVKFSAVTNASVSNGLENPADSPEDMAAGAGASSEKEEKETETKQRYEDIYFDSDESEGEDEVTRKRRSDKKEFMSNDDLFYDPKSDSKDQEWVDKRRRQFYPDSMPNQGGSGTSKGQGTSATSGSSTADDLLGADTDAAASKKKSIKLPPGIKPLPTSDAVLNCPACFTVLCLDCQRHEFYNNQYRAMFVMNCTVNPEDVIYAPLKQRKFRSRRGNKEAQAQSFSTEPTTDDIKDKFNTVKCKVCNTQIGVYDHNEVYHFTNVLASHS